MKLLRNEELEESKWLDLLEKGEFSSPFQTPEFYKFYNTVIGFSADVFALEFNDAYTAIVVVTVQKEQGIKGFFSKRGIVFGGPVLLSSETEKLEYLLREVNRFYKRKLIFLESRNNFDFSKINSHFENSNWSYEEHLNVQLDLADLSIDDVLSGMKYNRRREIKISYKEGAEARLAKNEEEVTEVYYMLKDLYKERVKKPLNPLSFFLEYYRNNLGKVFVVIHDNNIIGGAFCIFKQNMSIYTMSYVGSRNYHKKIFPTHIAIMKIIEFGIENKLKMVDFMGAGKPNIPYGVRDFKLQFGGDLVEHGRYKIIYKPLLYKIGVLGVKILSKIR